MGRSLAILLRISCWDSPRSSRSSSSLSEWDRWNYVGQDVEGKTNNTCDLSMAQSLICDVYSGFAVVKTFNFSGRWAASCVRISNAGMPVTIDLNLVVSEGYLCFCPSRQIGAKAEQSCNITFSCRDIYDWTLETNNCDDNKPHSPHGIWLLLQSLKPQAITSHIGRLS